jgi:hypothetical protein
MRDFTYLNAKHQDNACHVNLDDIHNITHLKERLIQYLGLQLIPFANISLKAKDMELKTLKDVYVLSEEYFDTDNGTCIDVQGPFDPLTMQIPLDT